ncbi:MAG: alpha/beta hydrolase family protein [Alphaproteobacteria bacterium]
MEMDGNLKLDRHRRMAGLASLALALALGCGSGDPTPDLGTRAPDGRFAVGRVRLVLVDENRGTDAYGALPATPSRSLRTLVLYPATGSPADDAKGEPEVRDDAPPVADRGPFPLFVFAHGYGGVAEVYLDLLASIAAEGYVVAAPDFPVTSTLEPGGFADFVNQPADASFVIDQVLRLASAGSGPLAGLVDDSRIGAGGQSLGGITTWGLSHQPCCRDARVGAAIPMAGAISDFPGSPLDLGEGRALFPGAPFDPVGPPTLVVHGEVDDIVPFASAIEAWSRTAQPRAFLRLPGGDHILPYVNIGGRTPELRAVIDASIAFLDLELKREAGASARLRSVASPGVAELEAEGID